MLIPARIGFVVVEDAPGELLRFDAPVAAIRSNLCVDGIVAVLTYYNRRMVQAFVAPLLIAKTRKNATNTVTATITTPKSALASHLIRCPPKSQSLSGSFIPCLAILRSIHVPRV